MCDELIYLAYARDTVRYLHNLIDYLLDLAAYLLGQLAQTLLVARIRVAQSTTTLPRHCNWADLAEVIDDLWHLDVHIVEELAIDLTRSLVDSLCDTAVQLGATVFDTHIF